MNKMMNLEFMCCVLFGFKEIYSKKMKKHHKETYLSYNPNNQTYILDQTSKPINK